MKIFIAGANGFIGKALIQELIKIENIQIVAISRFPKTSNHPRLTWKQCDLYSLKDTEAAMVGCTEAVYLVHSMMPSSGLTQGSFYDYDLLLADNFARAAKLHHIQHIIYLGGMIPNSGELSWHLRSRLEVENTFRSSQIPLTTLRAGLIIGHQGSSFEILRKLVKRLPFMICPAWTRTESQPIALNEIIEVILSCIQNRSVQGRIYDVGGPEIMTYQNLLLKTTQGLGVRRKIVSFNLIPLKISRFWVRWITGTSKDLVYPLVLSLKHRMVAEPLRSWPHWKHKRISIEEAIEIALSSDTTIPTTPIHQKINHENLNEVRSIQRLVLPTGKNAEWVAEEYFRWLPTFLAFFIRVKVEGNICRFLVLNTSIPLLILEKSAERSTPDRQLLYIRGGILVSKKMGRGRLEFREALEKKVIIAAIHEFIPALPWPIYLVTQALIHLWVMHQFHEHLKTQK